MSRIGIVWLAIGLTRLAAQTQINFTSTSFEVGRNSSGANLTASYTFALGSFGAFTPTSSNVALWAANFTAVTTNGTVAWDESFTSFSQTATLSSNGSGFTTSDHAYIWGYNTKTIASGTEWILFANNTWLFPASSAADPTSWDINDAGTTAIIGTLNSLGSVPYIQTAAIAVPEPATYAAIFGALAVGLVAYRRRRAAA